MAWNPENPVIDVSPIVTNLLAYIRSNQTAVLKWANGNQDGLAGFQVVYNSDEGSYQNDIFPNLQAVRERHRMTGGEYGAKVEYSIDLLLEVKGADATQLKKDAKKYGRAIESILLNIPAETLMANVSEGANPVINELTSEETLLSGELNNWMVGTYIRFAFEFLI
jgi:hypothetical protein